MEVNKQRIAELVGKIQSGDNSCFEELYKLTSERAYFVALQFLKNNQDAEDVLQESYMKALSKINELDKPESFSSWLNQIVANKSKDFLKKKKPMLFNSDEEETDATELLPDEDTDFSPEGNLDQTELQETVKEILDELSEEKRACILMMYYEELSVGEIAEALEIPEGTVKTRLFSARKDLKEKFAKRGITSAYSIAPIGVVIWALRKMSDAVSKTFVSGGASAKVLAGITVAGAGTAASVAVAGTTAASTAAAAAVGAGTATATGAATGTGIAAKIAALTVAQKIVAGVSVAAVVAGGTAGVVTVANNDKKDDISTTAYTEEYTTAPSFETTIAVEALGTVEFGETTGLSVAESTNSDGSTVKNSATASQSSADNKTTADSAKTTVKSSSTSAKQTTTKNQTTAQKTTATTQKATTTAAKTGTTKLTTTKKETTTKSTTAKPETTTKKVTTTKATTTKPTTTEEETTTEATTTTTKATTTTTTEATTLADPIVNITYNIAGLEGDYAYEPFSVSPGTVVDAQFIRDKLVADPELGFIEATVQSGDFTSSAESGETYNFYVVGIKG